MSNVVSQSLEVHVIWASRNQWEGKRTHDWPCYAHSLWLMLEGEVEVLSEQESWTVGVGQLFLWPKDKVRRVVTLQPSTWLSLGLYATSPTQIDLLSTLPSPLSHTLLPSEEVLMFHWMQQLCEVFNHMVSWNPRRYPDSANPWERDTTIRPGHFDVLEMGLANAVVGWCWNLWGTMDLTQALHMRSPAWLIKTLECIEQDPGISVAQLAKMIGFSSAQFRRLFNAAMRQSPQTYLQNRRLRVAQELLDNTDLPIAEVALKSGFATPTNFMNLWKRTHGLSALQYRKSHQ